MTAKLEQRPSERDDQELGPLEAQVRDNVLLALGTPPGLRRVQVKCLWPGRFRVNVFVGDGSGTFKVAHSYFLEAGPDGQVTSSSPPLERAY